MSSKRSKKARTDENKASAGAAAFASDPLLFANELTVAQLRKVLSERGVPGDELKSLQRKHQLVERLLKLDSGHKRVADALNRRSDDVDERSGGAFSRLSLSLVVLVAQFLDNRSLATAACVCRLLRVRLSLSLKGTPSPALAALRTIVLCKIDMDKPKKQQAFLTSLFVRTTQLQRLQVQYFKDLPALPASLLHLTLLFHHPTLEADRFFPVFSQCQLLRSLELTNTAGWRLLWLNGGAPVTAPFLPSLRFLHIRRVDADVVAAFLESAPDLEHFRAWYSHMSNTRPLLSRLPKLRRMALEDCSPTIDVDFLTNVPLEELQLCNAHVDSLRALPRSLVTLSLVDVKTTVLIPGFMRDYFTALRSLTLDLDDKLSRLLDGACLPELETLTLEDDAAQMAHALVAVSFAAGHKALPKLAQLRLRIVPAPHMRSDLGDDRAWHKRIKREKRKWQKECEQLAAAALRVGVAFSVTCVTEGPRLAMRSLGERFRGPEVVIFPHA